MRKLLIVSRAESATEAERESALRFAQNLVDKFDIKEHEVVRVSSPSKLVAAASEIRITQAMVEDVLRKASPFIKETLGEELDQLLNDLLGKVIFK